MQPFNRKIYARLKKRSVLKCEVEWEKCWGTLGPQIGPIMTSDTDGTLATWKQVPNFRKKSLNANGALQAKAWDLIEKNTELILTFHLKEYHINDSWLNLKLINMAPWKCAENVHSPSTEALKTHNVTNPKLVVSENALKKYRREMWIADLQKPVN